MLFFYFKIFFFMDFVVFGVYVFWMNDKNIFCLYWFYEFIFFIDFFIKIAFKIIIVKVGFL